MKQLTVYESTDGSRWNDVVSAVKRDAIDAKVREIESLLPKRPDLCGVRISVPTELVEECKRRTILLCREQFPDTKEFFHEPISEIHPMGICGRILDDSDTPINRIWGWLCCYSDGWLYQQPFYALNPGKFIPS